MLSNYSVDTLRLSKDEVVGLVRHMTDNNLREIKGQIKPLPPDKSSQKSTKSKPSKTFSISKYFSSHPKNKKDNKEKGCCCSCCKSDEEDEEFGKIAANVQESKHIIQLDTIHDFISEIGFLTRNARTAFNCLNEVKSAIEYTNDPSAEAQGLSKVGGYIWMLTYSIQHLVTPLSNSINLKEQLLTTQYLYQEIASNTHKLATTVNNVEEILFHYRECAAWVVKKCERVFMLEESPFVLKPELQSNKINRTKRRIDISMTGTNNIDEENDGLFHVQWSPLTILVKLRPEDSWDAFASLGIIEKVRIVETFMKESTNLVNKVTERIGKSTDYVAFKTITYETSVTSLKTEVTSMIYPVVNFLSKDFQELPFDKDAKMIQRSIDDFWFTIDALQSVGHDVKLLLQETRDIVRTCYIYATQFYHWKLTDYDKFEPCDYPNGKRPTRTSIFFSKIVGNNRRVSENLLFLSMADFTSSIYQYIAQENAIVCKEINMILDKFEEEEHPETWGLVPGAFDHLKVYPVGYIPQKPYSKPNIKGKSQQAQQAHSSTVKSRR